ncbi:protein phosphatase 2C domain-containing protein [Amycolatopsis sp. YIM 10]|uniref:protein phosphatase 2C domain-containing protein n=1 Tax=Amycolatopsis sp. YIM 10 TaxID=2653857 RepID=UPI0012901FC3|nr:protein phosphatase 2C domain-containing protein [Amycolatopsis sp. YIM 10]
MAVWTEREPGRGEDAEPLLLFHRPERRGLLAVFDGVGGAGRANAGSGRSGAEHSQAWVAARRARGLAEEWFSLHLPTELGEHIADRLGEGAPPAGRMRGSMRRELPTTLAALCFRLTGNEVGWEVLWAGDSRCYVAEEHLGLQQLSRDDTESADALELLTQDPPMTNMVSSSRAFSLNHWRGRAQLPCVLLCATDGFFGYVGTPAEFEHLLWNTLVTAQNCDHWSALLADRVAGYTGDDASIVVTALGYRDFDEFRARFRPRADTVWTTHAEPMERVRPGDRAALVAARAESWHRYRSTYENRLAEGSPW